MGETPTVERSFFTTDYSGSHEAGISLCRVLLKNKTLTNPQTKVPFGDAVVSTIDTCIGVELCEELFTPARLLCCHFHYLSRADTLSAPIF
jgi:hypothetical protein